MSDVGEGNKKVPPENPNERASITLYEEPTKPFGGTSTRDETRDKKDSSETKDSSVIKPENGTNSGLDGQTAEQPKLGETTAEAFRLLLEGVKQNVPSDGQTFGQAVRRALNAEKFVTGMDNSYALGAEGGPSKFKGYSIPGENGQPGTSLKFYDNGYVRADMPNGDQISFSPDPPKGDGKATIKPKDGGPPRQVDREEAAKTVFDKKVSDNPYFTGVQLRADGRLNLTMKDGSKMIQFPSNDSRKWSMTGRDGSGTVTALPNNRFEASLKHPTSDGVTGATFNNDGRAIAVRKVDAVSGESREPKQKDKDAKPAGKKIDDDPQEPSPDPTEDSTDAPVDDNHDDDSADGTPASAPPDEGDALTDDDDDDDDDAEGTTAPDGDDTDVDDGDDTMDPDGDGTDDDAEEKKPEKPAPIPLTPQQEQTLREQVRTWLDRGSSQDKKDGAVKDMVELTGNQPDPKIKDQVDTVQAVHQADGILRTAKSHSIEHLTKQIPNPATRDSAIKGLSQIALGQTGNSQEAKRAQETLVEIAKQVPETKDKIVDTLLAGRDAPGANKSGVLETVTKITASGGEPPPDRVREILRDGLKSDSPERRQDAMNAMKLYAGKWDAADRQAITQNLSPEVLRELPNLPKDVLEGLKPTISDAARKHLTEGNHDQRINAVRALETIDGDAAKSLTAMLDRPETRQAGINGLAAMANGAIDDPNKTQAARQKLGELGDKSEPDRKAVMEALASSHPPAKDEHSSLELLGRLAAKGDVPETARKALHDGVTSRSPLIQRSAMEGMNHLAKADKFQPSDFEAIRNNYSFETTHQTLRMLEGLPENKREEYRKELVKGLESKVNSDDRYTRENAIGALATIGGKDGIEAIKRQGLTVTESKDSPDSVWVPPKTMYHIKDKAGTQISAHHYDTVDPYTGIKPMPRVESVSRADGSSWRARYKETSEFIGKQYSGGGVISDRNRYHMTNDLEGFTERTATKDPSYSTLIKRDANYKIDENASFDWFSGNGRGRQLPEQRTDDMKAFLASEGKKTDFGYRQDTPQPGDKKTGDTARDTIAERTAEQLRDLAKLASGPPPNTAAEDLIIAAGGQTVEGENRAKLLEANMKAVDGLVNDLGSADTSKRQAALTRLTNTLDPAVKNRLDKARVDRQLGQLPKEPSARDYLRVQSVLTAEHNAGNSLAADGARWAGASRVLAGLPTLKGEQPGGKQVAEQSVDALATQARDGNKYAREGLYGTLLAGSDDQTRDKFNGLAAGANGADRPIKAPDAKDMGPSTKAHLELSAAKAVAVDAKRTGGEMNQAEAFALVSAFSRASEKGGDPQVARELQTAIDAGLAGKGKDNLTKALDEAVKAGGPGSKALADAYLKSHTPEQVAANMDSLATQAKAGNPAALAIIARSAAGHQGENGTSTKARQALEGMADTPEGRATATRALLDAVQSNNQRSPAAIESLGRLSANGELPADLQDGVRNQLNVSLAAQNGLERAAAIKSLMSNADNWTKQDTDLIKANMQPDMVRALKNLPEATLNKHREGFLTNARDILSTGKRPPTESGTPATTQQKETAIETLVSLSGNATATDLGSQYGKLGLTFEADPKDPNSLTVKTADSTKMEFTKSKEESGFRLRATERQDGSFKYNFYGDNNEFRGNSEGTQRPPATTIFKDALGQNTEATQWDGHWPGGRRVKADFKDGKPQSVKDSHGYQLDTPDGGKTWVSKFSGEKFEGKLSIANDGSFSVTGGNRELVRRIDGSQTVYDRTAGTTVDTKPDGTSITTNGAGEVTRTVDAKGNTNDYVNGEGGKLKSYKDSTGEWERQTDGTWKNKTSGAVEPKGDRWVDKKTGALQIDGEGNKHTSRQLDGSVFTYDRNSTGALRIKNSIDAAGKSVDYDYKGDETDPSAVNYGAGWWRAQNAEKTNWKKDNSTDAPWNGTVKVNHETGQMREDHHDVPGKVTLRNSDGSQAVLDKNGDVTELTTARNETWKFKYDKPHHIAEVTKPDGSVAENTPRGFRGPGATKVPAIDIDRTTLTVRENRPDGGLTVTRANGQRDIVDRDGRVRESENAHKIKTTFERNQQGELTGRRIDRPDGTWDKFDGSGTRESKDKQGNVTKYDINGLITDVTPVSGPHLHVDRAPDGTIKSIGNSTGPVFDAHGTDGKTFAVRGTNPPDIVRGTPFVQPNGEFGFRKDDGSAVSRSGSSSVIDKDNRSMRLGDDNSKVVSENGLVVASQDANGFLRAVHKRDQLDPNKLTEVAFGSQLWTRKGEGQWTSSDGKTLNGDIKVDKDGNFSMIDSSTKKEHIFKTDGSTVIRDSEGDKRVHRVTDKEGSVTDMYYNKTGNLVSMRMPDGSVYNKVPDSPGLPQPQPERWVKDGTAEVKQETRRVDSDGTVRITHGAGHHLRETVRTTDGWQRENGRDGHHQFVKQNKDGSNMIKNEAGQTVQTTDALGRTRKFGYDQVGTLNRVEYSNGDVHTSTDGKSWQKQGSTNPPWVGEMSVSSAGDLIETQKTSTGSKETIRKADGSTVYAENGKYTRIEPVKRDPMDVLGRGSDGNPNKIRFDSDKNAYWATEDGQNWKRFDNDGKALGQEQKFKLSIDRNGAIIRDNFAGQPPTVESTATNGTITTQHPDGRKISERRSDETKIDYQYDNSKNYVGKVETRKDGTVIETDAKDRVTRAKGQSDRRYEYNDKNEVTAFSIDGERYARKDGSPPDVYFHVRPDGSVINGRDGQPEKIAAMVNVKQDGTTQMYGRDGSISSHRLDGSRVVQMDSGAMRMYDTRGALTDTIDAKGTRTHYDRDLAPGQEVLGRADRLSRITFGEGAGKTSWTTQDGFHWKQEGTDKSFTGFINVNNESGERVSLSVDGDRFRYGLDGTQKGPEHIALAESLKTVTDSKDGWFTRKSTRDKIYREQLRDKSAEQLYIMGSKYDANNPMKLRDDLVDSVGGADFFRGVRTGGMFDRRDRPGDDYALQLMVDRSESQSSWFWRDRSQADIRRSEHDILGGASEERRRQINDSMMAMYGVSLSEHYADSSSNKHGSVQGDEFHRRAMELYATTGRDLRTPEQQTELMSLALKSGSGDRLANFMMASAEHIATDAGRAKFKAEGGAEKIRSAFTETRTTYNRAGMTHTSTVTDRQSVQEATDYMDRGKLAPTTAIQKATGTFTNSDDVVRDALENMSDKDQSNYVDGRALSQSGRDRESMTASEKESLDFYKTMQKSLEGLHWFGKERKAFGYEARIGRGEGSGTDLTQGIVDIGGHWTNSHQENLSRVENMSRESFDRLMVGARWDQPKIKDGGGNELPYHSEFQAQIARGMELNLGSGEYVDKAKELVNKKIEHALKVNEMADTDPAKLKDLIPAFKNMDQAKFDQLVAGQKVDRLEQGRALDKAVTEGGRKEGDLTAGERETLAAFRAGDKKPLTAQQEEQLKAYRDNKEFRQFMEGRAVARELERTQGATPSETLKARQEIFNKLGDPARQSLEYYRSQLYDSQKSEVRRPLDQALEHNVHTVSNDRQAMWDAITNMSPDDRRRYRDEPEGFRKTVDGLLDKHFGGKTSAHRMAADHILSQIASDTTNNPPKMPEVTLGDKMLAKSGISGLSSADAARMIAVELRGDKDGKIRDKLATDPEFKAAAMKVLSGSESSYNKFVAPLLDPNKGILSPETIKEINTTTRSTGKESEREEFNAAGYFKDAVLNATPQGLAYWRNNPEEFAKMTSHLTAAQKELATQIIMPKGQEGNKNFKPEIKAEDRIRAFALDLGVSKDEVRGLLSGMNEEERTRTSGDYALKYKSEMRNDVVRKVDEAERMDYVRLTRTAEWTTPQTVIAAHESLTGAHSGPLGSMLASANIMPEEKIASLVNADFNANMKGNELTPEELERRWGDVQKGIQSFHNDKRSVAETVATGVTIAVSIAAAPFTGGWSLAGLATLSSVALGTGLTVALAKQAALGDTHRGASETFGDTVKYTILTAAGLIDPTHLGAKTGAPAAAAGTATARTFWGSVRATGADYARTVGAASLGNVVGSWSSARIDGRPYTLEDATKDIAMGAAFAIPIKVSIDTIGALARIGKAAKDAPPTPPAGDGTTPPPQGQSSGPVHTPPPSGDGTTVPKAEPVPTGDGTTVPKAEPVPTGDGTAVPKKDPPPTGDGTAVPKKDPVPTGDNSTVPASEPLPAGDGGTGRKKDPPPSEAAKAHARDAKAALQKQEVDGLLFHVSGDKVEGNYQTAHIADQIDSLAKGNPPLKAIGVELPESAGPHIQDYLNGKIDAATFKSKAGIANGDNRITQILDAVKDFNGKNLDKPLIVKAIGQASEFSGNRGALITDLQAAANKQGGKFAVFSTAGEADGSMLKLYSNMEAINSPKATDLSHLQGRVDPNNELAKRTQPEPRPFMDSGPLRPADQPPPPPLKGGSDIVVKAETVHPLGSPDAPAQLAKGEITVGQKLGVGQEKMDVYVATLKGEDGVERAVIVRTGQPPGAELTDVAKQRFNQEQAAYETSKAMNGGTSRYPASAVRDVTIDGKVVKAIVQEHAGEMLSDFKRVDGIEAILASNLTHSQSLEEAVALRHAMGDKDFTTNNHTVYRDGQGRYQVSAIDIGQGGKNSAIPDWGEFGIPDTFKKYAGQPLTDTTRAKLEQLRTTLGAQTTEGNLLRGSLERANIDPATMQRRLDSLLDQGFPPDRSLRLGGRHGDDAGPPRDGPPKDPPKDGPGDGTPPKPGQDQPPTIKPKDVFEPAKPDDLATREPFGKSKVSDGLVDAVSEGKPAAKAADDLDVARRDLALRERELDRLLEPEITRLKNEFEGNGDPRPDGEYRDMALAKASSGQGGAGMKNAFDRVTQSKTDVLAATAKMNDAMGEFTAALNAKLNSVSRSSPTTGSLKLKLDTEPGAVAGYASNTGEIVVTPEILRGSPEKIAEFIGREMGKAKIDFELAAMLSHDFDAASRVNRAKITEMQAEFKARTGRDLDYPTAQEAWKSAAGKTKQADHAERLGDLQKAAKSENFAKYSTAELSANRVKDAADLVSSGKGSEVLDKAVADSAYARDVFGEPLPDGVRDVVDRARRGEVVDPTTANKAMAEALEARQTELNSRMKDAYDGMSAREKEAFADGQAGGNKVGLNDASRAAALADLAQQFEGAEPWKVQARELLDRVKTMDRSEANQVTALLQLKALKHSNPKEFYLRHTPLDSNIKSQFTGLEITLNGGDKSPGVANVAADGKTTKNLQRLGEMDTMYDHVVARMQPSPAKELRERVIKEIMREQLDVDMSSFQRNPEMLERALIARREISANLKGEGTEFSGLSKDQLVKMRDALDDTLRNSRSSNQPDIFDKRFTNGVAAIEGVKTLIAQGKMAHAEVLADLIGIANKYPNEVFPFKALTEAALDPKTNPEVLRAIHNKLEETARVNPLGKSNKIRGEEAVQVGIMAAVAQGVPGYENWIYLPTGKQSFADQGGMDGVLVNARTGESRPLDFYDRNPDPDKNQKLKHGKAFWAKEQLVDVSRGYTVLNDPTTLKNAQDYISDFMKTTEANKAATGMRNPGEKWDIIDHSNKLDEHGKPVGGEPPVARENPYNFKISGSDSLPPDFLTEVGFLPFTESVGDPSKPSIGAKESPELRKTLEDYYKKLTTYMKKLHDRDGHIPEHVVNVMERVQGRIGIGNMADITHNVLASRLADLSNTGHPATWTSSPDGTVKMDLHKPIDTDSKLTDFQGTPAIGKSDGTAPSLKVQPDGTVLIKLADRTSKDGTKVLEGREYNLGSLGDILEVAAKKQAEVVGKHATTDGLKALKQLQSDFEHVQRELGAGRKLDLSKPPMTDILKRMGNTPLDVPGGGQVGALDRPLGDGTIRTVSGGELNSFLAANPQIGATGLSPNDIYKFEGNEYQMRGYGADGKMELVRVT